MIVGIIFATAAAASPSQTCDLAAVTTARTVYEALVHRALRVIENAASSNPDKSAQLDRFIAPSAEFSLGGGDVGRPLGAGVAGAKALAATMKADEFRYLGWDYIDGPSDGCGERSVTIEFVDTREHSISKVEFKFDQGRIVEAKGWQRSFTEGTLQGRGYPKP